MTTLYTIGHSTRSAEEFVDLLRAHSVRRLIDVRTVPKSRRNPQFARDVLGPYLRNRRIAYRHVAALGGLRKPRKDSANAGWRNTSFRGYADHMQTPEFQNALAQLMAWAEERPTAVMCAEAVPWRCHRSLIADALIVRGFEVRDIMTTTSARQHTLNPMAQRRGDSLVYPFDPRAPSP